VPDGREALTAAPAVEMIDRPHPIQPEEPAVFRSTAHIYDLIYEASGKDYATESSEIHSLIEEHRPGAGTLLDVACGTGGHLRHLRRWYDVTGVDLDPTMVAEARRHLPDITLVEGDMRTLAVGESFDAVVCLFSSIGYLASTQELTSAVAAMGRHLHPGGVLIIDGWVRPDAWIDGGVTTVETVRTDEVDIVRMSRSRRQGDRTSLEMHHLVATADGIEHLVDYHELTLFGAQDYEAAFERAGLAVTSVESPMPGRDRYIGISAL
jgi:SAM-dependent methyltransferase